MGEITEVESGYSNRNDRAAGIIDTLKLLPERSVFIS
jgi:hypothetical protein